VGGRATPAHAFAENRHARSGTIRSMSAPSSVVGCSSCGALHTPAPGDRGLCASCRRLLVSDVPWRADSAGSDPAAAAAAKRSDKGNVRRLRPGRAPAWRRIAVGAAVALLVAGLAAAVATRRQPLSDSWTKIERHMKTDVWSTLRRRTLAIWATTRRRGSEAWVAVRRRLPFDGSSGKGSDSIAPASPSRAGAADETVARGTHKRKTASKRRSRDD
jgi:hypothetical protein